MHIAVWSRHRANRHAVRAGQATRAARCVQTGKDGERAETVGLLRVRSASSVRRPGLVLSACGDTLCRVAASLDGFCSILQERRSEGSVMRQESLEQGQDRVLEPDGTVRNEAVSADLVPRDSLEPPPAENMAWLEDYCVGRYEEEYNRANRLDAKASRYLSVVTVLLGLLFATTPAIVGAVPGFGWRTLSGVVVLILACLLFSSWLCLFRVLRVAGLDRLPLDEMREACLQKNLATVQWKLAETARSATSFNIKVGDEKVLWLKRAYCLLHLAMVTSFMVFVVLLYSSCIADHTERSNSNMGDPKDNERPTAQPDPNTTPDLTEPPAKPDRIEEDAGRIDIRTKDSGR